ncbi:hypothetical protein LTR70_005544 [Exophiala xenobiotica]|uniref:Glycolipid transfer protein domain-containing protein n=1 Tax=Lithohypha guttulata TaxID=1690604 RepID=A0ABR0K9R5_9EURO|nr:hypothetical protein LTR24_005239 [Lithohypha guttulata]KAK5318060.1 hypothetical protein LTR70_005544 [Exophiala xenobiotica]
MASIPAGKTWFDNLKQSFVNVPMGSDQGVDTSTFLDAAEATATLFDLLGSVAFTPVKNDMIGNVKKIRDRQLASPGNSSTLQSLCKSELAGKSHKATEGLLWLVRGLDFTAQALRADLTNNAGVSITEQKPKKELADSFRDAYKLTLAPHHSFMVKPIFSAAMSATPYRKDLYAKMLGQGAGAETFQSEEEKWLGALEERIAILKTFLASKEAKW